MGKYDPLNRYLKRRHDAALEFSFTELERLLGAFLPNGAQTKAWWSNDADLTPPMVQPHAWLDAGYEATLLPGERVRFHRRSPPGRG
ncbi:MAG: hypothetical protein V4514_19635 [Pseudomonadota bacterium]|uniref:DUF7662 domain-containing protein n=1 Tax=Phenylobacterium sp. TaxID=1871053 RepID=UPI0025F00896|nr:hypothetical protein [Phenylobacterium sp.]MBT9471991.1 hypothetical protein [Phenylobacterium sp.]